MPTGAVKTQHDERAWEKAKEIVRQQYPDLDEKSARFWRLVMGVYHRVRGGAAKAEIVHRDVGTGELSERLRAQIGRPGDEKREDMPAHVFLLPGERKYPVKVKQGGKWVYSAKLLLAAARRARMLGREDLARRADAIRTRLLGSGDNR